jgi:LysM repeat protein
MIALGKMPADIQITVKESDKTPVETKSLKPNLNSEQVKSVEKLAKPSAYPDGEFKINGTKAVFVKKGTPFLVIAKQYDIDLSKIFEFNEIQQAEETNKDQLVYLQRKRKTGNNTFHIVKPGETLHDIAQLEAIRLESLIELNWLKGGMQPAIGEQLSLKSKSHSTPKLALRENYTIAPAAKNKSTE